MNALSALLREASSSLLLKILDFQMNVLSVAVVLSAFIFSVELSVELAKCSCALSKYCVSDI